MRIDDRALLLISLAASTAGLVILAALSLQNVEAAVEISEIDYDDVGSTIAIEGNISSKKVHGDGHIFLAVADYTGKISVVIFAETAKELERGLLECLDVGNVISVVGRVQEYRGLLEIIPARGSAIRCSRP